MKFADPDRPERGLFFDGRVAEDFKLKSGTWVSVGTLRVAGITALAPLAQDIVVSGQAAIRRASWYFRTSRLPRPCRTG